MDIGRPQRIIEIEPAALPVPGEVEPERQPEREPVPAAPEQRTS